MNCPICSKEMIPIYSAPTHDQKITGYKCQVMDPVPDSDYIFAVPHFESWTETDKRRLAIFPFRVINYPSTGGEYQSDIYKFDPIDFLFLVINYRHPLNDLFFVLASIPVDVLKETFVCPLEIIIGFII